MPTVIRKSGSTALTDRRREDVHSIGWQVRSNVWSPPSDVYETEQAYVLRVEVAGMRETDFEVTFEDGFLFVNGNRSDVRERRAYHQMEIRFGKFSSALAVPGPVDIDRAEAKYADGFLTIVLPKQN